MNPLSLAIVGVFILLLVAVLAWSPLARGLVKESVTRPNEPCTFSPTGRGVEVRRNTTPQPPPDEVIGAGPMYKWALGAVFVITLLALILLVALVFAPGNDRATSAAGACEKAFLFGFSALVGLIGGKALK